MDNQELEQKLMATFVDELHHHVECIGRELLAVEKQPDSRSSSESWDRMLRAAHTLKGASSIVNVTSIRDACHQMEEIFSAYRHRGDAMPEAVVSTMLRTLDAFQSLASQLRTGGDSDATAVENFVSELLRMATEASASAVDASADRQAGLTETTTDEDRPSATKIPDGPPSRRTLSRTSQTKLDKQQILRELMPLFLDELDDHVATLSEQSLRLENATDARQRDTSLNELFRAAHSLKGASRSVEIGSIHDVCHHLEDLLSALRDNELEVTPEIVSTILHASDAIADAGRRIRAGESLAGSPIEQLEQHLAREPMAAARGAAASKVREDDADRRPIDTPTKASAVSSLDDPNLRGEADPKFNPVGPPDSTNSPSSPSASEVGQRLPGSERSVAIRVAPEKLDALLAYSGELLVARRRFAMRARDATEIRDLAADLRAQLRSAEQPFAGSGKSVLRSVSSESVLDAEALAETATAIRDLATRLDRLANGMESDNRLLRQTCKSLDEEVHGVRMLPFAIACGGLERIVRDVANTTGKQVSLTVEGSDVQMDRSVLDGLKDPLLHLVRNAVDHGVESPAQRVARGKPKQASVRVAASLRGGQVEIVVEDDGRGFDLDRIETIARSRGVDIPDTENELARLVFTPGFSTADSVTAISGRGVGLDVVNNSIAALHGDIDLSFVEGKGTRFTLLVPLTLTTIRCMLVEADDQTYAIPTSSVHRLVRFAPNDLGSTAGREVLLSDKAPIPIMPLNNAIRLESTELSERGLAIVLNAGEQRFAFEVDDVISEQEVLVTNLGPRIRHLRHFSGATLMASGQLALVMNAANVVRSAFGAQPKRRERTPRPEPKRRRLLLADDSATTRMLLKKILETSGYDVVDAEDGNQAWELAKTQDFDAIISDVDMPRLNGFELTSRLRRLDATAEVPVVLVTARGSDEDKRRGVEVGASAYIVKGAFDQHELLDAVAQLI